LRNHKPEKGHISVANPYTTTISFPIEPVNNVGDTVRLVLKLTTYAEGSNVSIDAEDYDLLVTDYGTLKYDWGFDESLLIYSDLTLALADPNKYLHDFIFDDGTVALATKFYFEVKFYINSILVFKGQPATDSVMWNEDNYLLSFTAIPPMDILNRELYYERGSGESAYYDDTDPLGYTPYSDAVEVTVLCRDIFRVMDSAINLYDVHKWRFTDTLSNQIYMNKVQLHDTEHIFGDYDVSTELNLSTLKDVLRYIGNVFQCFFVLIGENVYMKQLYACYDPAEIDKADVLSWKKMYDHLLYKYVYCFSDTGDHNHGAEIPESDTFTPPDDQGQYKSSVENENLEIKFYFDVFDEDDTRVLSNSDNDERLSTVYDENEYNADPAETRIVEAIADSVYNFRMNYQSEVALNRNRQTEEITIQGVGWTMDADLKINMPDGTKRAYFIMGIEKNFKKNETRITAMFLGTDAAP
jgi:hypothetical protein